MFVTDTRKLLRLFWLANERDLDIHPEAMTAARRSLWAADAAGRASMMTRAAMFLDIVSGKQPLDTASCR